MTNVYFKYILMICVIGFLNPSLLSAQCYKQDCSGSVSYYENLDPSTVEAKEWEIRLYVSPLHV
jgi:hypothetical protein